MGEEDRTQNSGLPTPLGSREEREAFLAFVAEKLEKLRKLVVNEARARNMEELYIILDPWQAIDPETKGSVLELIFWNFPALAEEFDLRTTQRNLWTQENLGLLKEDDGAMQVAQRFLSYFIERWSQRWRVLIPAANLKDVSRPPVEVTPGITVELRKIQNCERQYFAQHSCLQQLPGDESVFFVVDLQAGDETAAIRKAKRAIQQYLAPYYLHAIRSGQEEPWYGPKPDRVRLSPFVYLVGDIESRPFRVDVEQLRGDAPLLTQLVDDEWTSSVREIVSKWHRKGFKDDLERHLVQATKWMFSAENEESDENAYLKHSIAWEALFPKSKKHARLKLCLWLVVFALSKQDIWSLRTVSQAERLRDRRNSLAHPEPNAGLTSTLQQDLRILKRALVSAVESAMTLRGLLLKQETPIPNWQCILSRLFEILSNTGADFKPGSISPQDRLLLETLGLCDGDGHLTGDGLAACVEAQIVRARLCWDDQKQSVRWLAHAFYVSMHRELSNLPHPRLHAALWVKKRRDSCKDFAEFWARSGIPRQAPSDLDLAELIDDLQRDFGITSKAVGWRE